MDDERNKRIMDGPITSSMRTDTPSQESIEALRERYAMHDKMTAKKPQASFDSVLTGVGREEQAQNASSHAKEQEREGGSAPSASSSSSGEAAPLASGATDTFEAAPKGALGRRPPLPSGRHPDTPSPGGGRGKVIIKA